MIRINKKIEKLKNKISTAIEYILDDKILVKKVNKLFKKYKKS